MEEGPISLQEYILSGAGKAFDENGNLKPGHEFGVEFTAAEGLQPIRNQNLIPPSGIKFYIPEYGAVITREFEVDDKGIVSSNYKVESKEMLAAREAAEKAFNECKGNLNPSEVAMYEKNDIQGLRKASQSLEAMKGAEGFVWDKASYENIDNHVKELNNLANKMEALSNAKASSNLNVNAVISDKGMTKVDWNRSGLKTLLDMAGIKADTKCRAVDSAAQISRVQSYYEKMKEAAEKTKSAKQDRKEEQQTDKTVERSFTNAVNLNSAKSPTAEVTHIFMNPENPDKIAIITTHPDFVELRAQDSNGITTKPIVIPNVQDETSAGYKAMMKFKEDHGFADNVVCFKDLTEATNYFSQNQSKGASDAASKTANAAHHHRKAR